LKKKSEGLGRKKFQILIALYGDNHHKISDMYTMLGKVLAARGNLGVETQGLYKRALAIYIRNHSDGADTAAGHVNIAGFYSQQGEIRHTYESKRRVWVRSYQ
jgi:phosphopentomutase